MCIPEANKKADLYTTVLANALVAPGFYRMVVDFPNADKVFAPGQFFQLRINPQGRDPLLRRPFAPSEVFSDMMAFVYAEVGRGTTIMAGLADGDQVSILAPLGSGFSLPEDPDTQAVIVGGGCGTPSLLVLSRALKAIGCSTHVAVGARSTASLLECDALAESATSHKFATDDGSSGLQGHAVMAAEELIKGLDQSKPIRIYSCGPEPMLKGLSALAAEQNLFCEVSLESRMACGFGACVGCVVKVKDDSRDEGFVYRKVCQDGPVFPAADLLWG